ncbi:MAG TPA: bifunctional phosphopantothenoylcysteine decarboxylase/phosphopantothenate--cysteine ligase CoaBC [Solirubrobacteraceae bacterium]|jgi:phosphopantothenoylcysteine decarboxylase/phosphopantothenate--cysteine ligase|nr:bifunctional phosphopantothenoylcysteine decarboxylase/phosphopantothenate--cysteine ligase CoaBC [Solirubrobacteraceae bacterium]
MARLLLGVSGGIAAYKAIETARLAVKAGHSVRVIQTPTSERFVGVASFEGITGAPVLTSEFEPDPARGSYPGEPVPERAPISHLALVERAEVFLIAPASANTIAKLAHGHADNLLSTAALAAACPVAVAPAMNNRMYLHPATQDNLETLGRRGVTIIPPAEGELASHGERGVGRLAEPADLLAACERLLGAAGAEPGSWAGRRVLVTAGGTREPIDSVRYIGNRSSGRMGFALADEAQRRGAAVTLIAANVALDPPPGVNVTTVETAAELKAATEAAFEAVDVLVMAAAVADFRPATAVASKIKKTEQDGPPTIELEHTDDILGGLRPRRRPGQVIVGFAAEHGAGAIDYGLGKLTRKGLDAIVVNDISEPGIGFDSDDNEVTILTGGGGRRHVPRATKAEVARAVLDEIERLGTELHGAA